MDMNSRFFSPKLQVPYVELIASKIWLHILSTLKKNFCSIIESYDLAICMVDVYTILCTFFIQVTYNEDNGYIFGKSIIFFRNECLQYHYKNQFANGTSESLTMKFNSIKLQLCQMQSLQTNNLYPN